MNKKLRTIFAFMLTTTTALMMVLWIKKDYPLEVYGFDLDSFFQCLFLYFLIFTFIYFIFLFQKEIVEKKWWKFARIYLPIAFILILISGNGGGGLFAGGFGGGYDREGMIWFTSGLFAILSLFIIVRAWLKNRKNP